MMLLRDTIMVLLILSGTGLALSAHSQFGWILLAVGAMMALSRNEGPTGGI